MWEGRNTDKCTGKKDQPAEGTQANNTDKGKGKRNQVMGEARGSEIHAGRGGEGGRSYSHLLEKLSLGVFNEGDRDSLGPCASRSPNSVDVGGKGARAVKVDNSFDAENVKATGCNVRGNKEGCLALTELLKALQPLGLAARGKGRPDDQMKPKLQYGK